MSFMQDVIRSASCNEAAIVRRLRELVEVESPSHDKGAVDRAMALAEGWARELGGVVKRHKQKVFGDVLELRFGKPRRGLGRVMLLGHLDTVWPVGTLAKMPWREEGGKLFGPGVLDMKSGVVMAFEALRVLRELGAERPVTLLLNSEEEIGSTVSRPITERVAKGCEAVFVLEPAQGLAYKTARKGVGRFGLRVAGVGAHAGVDFEKGHSAVLEMARLIETVSGFTDLSKGRTVNVGVVRGGTLSNVVADECSAEVDVRVVRAGDAAVVERLLRGLRVRDKACGLEMSGGMNRPPMERKAGTVALFRRAQKLAAEIGLELEEASTGGGSDGNFTAGIGVATLDGMGSVGVGAHAPHEHIERKYLVERTALLAGMVASV